MNNQFTPKGLLHSWQSSFSAILQRKVLMMLLLGFSSGLPLLLIFSSLSLWLREAGIDRSAVTYFSWAALGYSFKFVWAPLVDRIPVPGLASLLGQRRAWLILAQLGVAASILLMASVDPAQAGNSLNWMGVAAVALGFSAATQDIVIDAYRIESAETELQALMSSAYIAGYRIGMVASGAGALYLASEFGSTATIYNYQAWALTYAIMASCMLVGIITTLLIHEPVLPSDKKLQTFAGLDQLRLVLVFITAVAAFVLVFFYSGDLASDAKATLTHALSNKHLASFAIEGLRLISAALIAAVIFAFAVKQHVVNPQLVEASYVSPIRQFFSTHGVKAAALLLALICLYRISDIVLGVISNVFYQDLGFDKQQIATVVKTFGLIMTIVGGFLGGIMVMHFGVIRVLMWGAVLTVITNLLFILLAEMGQNMPMLYLVISADNLAAGVASAAFVAFLSALVDLRFTAMQYAIFSSLMTLLPKVIGGYSGSIVDAVGYSWFFAFAAILGLPVLLLIHLAGKRLALESEQNQSPASL